MMVQPWFLKDKQERIRHYVYILLCGNNQYYVGQTSDIVNRLYAHISGGGAKFTKKNRPCALVHLEITPNRECAEAREREWFKLIKNKKYNFALPVEFEEFFYRIVAQISTRNLMAPLVGSKESQMGCKEFVDVPIAKEWEEG